MKYGTLFAGTAALLLAVALAQRGGWLTLLWPALSFALLTAGYLGGGAAVFGKGPRGLLSPVTTLLLLPYLVVMWCIWHVYRVWHRERAYDQLTDHWYIGRRLLSHECPDHFEHVVDLTSEFNEPRGLRRRSYLACPILDGSAPTVADLQRWTERVSQLAGNVYIHCALGHGRTGLFAAALLLTTGKASTPEAALAILREKRPQLQLTRRQLHALHAFHDSRRSRAA